MYRVIRSSLIGVRNRKPLASHSLAVSISRSWSAASTLRCQVCSARFASSQHYNGSLWPLPTRSSVEQQFASNRYYFFGHTFLSPLSSAHGLHQRALIHSSINYRDKDNPSSKVEQTVNALKEAAAETSAAAAAASTTSPATTTTEPSAVTVVAKRSLRKRIWDEIVHYYHGFRLLYIDSKIALRLLWNVIRGHELSRREYRQLTRTTADIFRMLPFSIFIIIPFMELLLPLYLWLFPGALPSTFQSVSDRETKIKQQLKVKLDMTKFLASTLDEMALQSKDKGHHSEAAKKFANFFTKIRESGHLVTNEEILKFSKLFEDEITLDSLSRPQLMALCRLLDLKSFGPDSVLRFQLRMQLKSLKSDDKMIAAEGVNSLTVPELQAACRARGMRALGVNEERLRTQLAQWLELSLNEKIPPSLLLLSRCLYLPESLPATDQLKATLQTLPLEAATETKYKIGETEGKIDNRTRLEVIKAEEAAIKREKAEAEKERREKAAAAAAAAEIITAAAAEAAQSAPGQASVGERISKEDAEELVDRAAILRTEAAAEELTGSSGTASPTADKKEEIELSKADLEDLEDALEEIEKRSLVLEKEELEDIKEEVADYKEDIQEFKELAETTGVKELRESRAAKVLRKRVDKMIAKMDKVMDKMVDKKSKIEEKIKASESDVEDAERQPIADSSELQDNLVNINEILIAMRKIQTVEDEDKVKRIVDVLDSMDVDHDGRVDVDHVIKVIELLGRENVNVSSEQMKDIVKLLIAEEKEEEEQRKRREADEADKK